MVILLLFFFINLVEFMWYECISMYWYYWIECTCSTRTFQIAQSRFGGRQVKFILFDYEWKNVDIRFVYESW